MSLSLRARGRLQVTDEHLGHISGLTNLEVMIVYGLDAAMFAQLVATAFVT